MFQYIDAEYFNIRSDGKIFHAERIDLLTECQQDVIV